MDSAIENCNQSSCLEPAKIVKQYSDDKLSNLPLDLIHQILSFLNTPEVVRTSLLSRNWRYIWTSVPVLNFNFRGFWRLVQYRELSYADCLSKFWEFVRRTLTIKEAPPVHRLHLACDYSDPEQLNLMLRLCAMRNVQELNLEALITFDIRPLPRAFVESVLAMTQNFNGVANLQSPTVFGNLKILRLVRIRFADADITEKLFSDCGALEELSIEYCCFMMARALNISSSNLQKLSVVNMGPTNRSISVSNFQYKLAVNTPNLVSFYYIGPAPRFSEFSDMPTLDLAFIKVGHISCSRLLRRDMSAMVFGFGHAKVLFVSSSWVQYFSPAYSWVFRGGVVFDRLSYLKLEFLGSEVEMEGLINLLKVSPNLEVLFIDYVKWLGGKILSETREEDVPCLSHKFRKIEIAKFSDSGFSMEFIEFFLRNGKSLEKIIIKQKKHEVDLRKLYALKAVQLASYKPVSVLVELLSDSGQNEMLHFVCRKRRGGLWQRILERESKKKESMRCAEVESGGSVECNKKRHPCNTSMEASKKPKRSM